MNFPVGFKTKRSISQLTTNTTNMHKKSITTTGMSGNQ